MTSKYPKNENFDEMINKKLDNLNYCCLNPMKNYSVVAKMYSMLIIGMLCISYCFTGIYCCLMKYDLAHLGAVIINLVLFGAAWQMLLKTTFFYRKRDRIRKVITIMHEEFWPTDFVDEELTENIKFIYKLCRILDISLSAGVALSVLGHSFTAILQGNFNLIVNLWLPQPVRFLIKSYPYYYFVQVFQFFYINTSTLSVVLQCDLILAFILAMIIVQLKLLKFRLLRIADKEIDEIRKEFPKIVNHHNLLYGLLAEVEDLFSPILLQLLCTSMFLIVISYLTALFAEELAQQILFMYVGTTAFGQFAMYCFLGQFIQDETLSVAEVAYLCKWENHNDADMRKSLIIIMHRSQKQVNITMGNFIVLNLENFTTVSRAMLSFFTFVINMKGG